MRLVDSLGRGSRFKWALPLSCAGERELIRRWEQLTASLVIGLSSFLLFCFLRRLEKYKVLYSPRTLLKGELPSNKE